MKRILSAITLTMLTMAGVITAQDRDKKIMWEEKPDYISIETGHESENAIGTGTGSEVFGQCLALINGIFDALFKLKK